LSEGASNGLIEFFRKANQTEDPFASVFFDKILPTIVTYAILLPSLIPKPIPTLFPQQRSTVTITRPQVINQEHHKMSEMVYSLICLKTKQAACILAHAFLGTFPSPKGQFRRMNFSDMFENLSQSEAEAQKFRLDSF